MPFTEAILAGLVSRAIWEAFRYGLKALKGGEFEKLYLIIDKSITKVSAGDRQLEEAIRGMFEDKSVYSQMESYLTSTEINAQTLINAFKNTTYYKQNLIKDNRLNEIFSHLHNEIIAGIRQDEKLGERLHFVFSEETLAVSKETLENVKRIKDYLLPDHIERK